MPIKIVKTFNKTALILLTNERCKREGRNAKKKINFYPDLEKTEKPDNNGDPKYQRPYPGS